MLMEEAHEVTFIILSCRGPNSAPAWYMGVRSTYLRYHENISKRFPKTFDVFLDLENLRFWGGTTFVARVSRVFHKKPLQWRTVKWVFLTLSSTGRPISTVREVNRTGRTNCIAGVVV